MTVHIYLRRSKNDEGKQQFSLDVQRAGCREFVKHRDLGEEITEHVDDGKAGDDFLNRHGIRRLMDEAQPGDVIVCRDQSRLGRDAIEVTLVIRELVRDRGCRLFYYVTGQEVQFANAIDQATTFIQGTGHQMELEAIRSRTREALRSRVREGRIAGGRCYGYQLDRRSDPSGRRYTVAIVDDDQAAIVRRIYQEYVDGRGLKAIARGLNHEGVASPSAGRRGTGSWAPSCIRMMLLNPRYRGMYIHGRIKKLRRSGSVKRVKADASEIITIDIPEWRIVDDETWLAAQARFTKQAPEEASNRHERPAAKYALSGIARCGECGGPIGCTRTGRRGGLVKAYACAHHRERGRDVCSVTVMQPMDEVEDALVDYLQREILNGSAIDIVLAEVRREVEAQMPAQEQDIAALEKEVAEIRTEQRRLAKAVALADDIPELVSELRQRSARIQHLEVQIGALQRTPEEVTSIINSVVESCRKRLGDLKTALAERADLREVFVALFPDGLTLTPACVEDQRRRRRVWRVKGAARVLGRSDCVATPPKSDRSATQKSRHRITKAEEAKRLTLLDGDPNGMGADYLDNSF